MKFCLPILLLALLAPLGATAQVAPGHAALPSISEILPLGIQPGLGLVAAVTGKGDVPVLAPRKFGKKQETEAGVPPTAAASSTLRIEFLAFLPPPKGPLPAWDEAFSKLALAAASPGGLAGLEYWSASRGRMRTLYSKAYRAVSKEDRSITSDPRKIADLGSGPPWRIVAWLEDLTFGGNLYAFNISGDTGEFSLEIANLETVRYLLLPLAKPGAMKNRIEVLPCAEGLLVHFSSVLEAPGFGASRVFESAGNKGLAVLGWFAGKAAALGLSSPIAIPLKMEEALRPAGLP
ncbi:MAG: hypothetical protein NT061_11715 [Spirochaetes bacterium]|nr:hypothetical protein [Spirochaetota bacterium]